MSDEPQTEDAPSGPAFPLRRHQLSHLPQLVVGEELFTSRFAASSDMSRCSAKCCREGVLVDITHRERILAEAALILEYMEPTQQRDPSHWFHEEEDVDLDFPSGRAVNTNAFDGRCVFLDSEKRCVLQRAEERSPGLKPFFCRAFPIAIVNGRLTLDATWCPSETQCCGPVARGERSTLDMCEYELAHVVGRDGVVELKSLASQVRETNV